MTAPRRVPVVDDLAAGRDTQRTLPAPPGRDVHEAARAGADAVPAWPLVARLIGTPG